MKLEYSVEKPLNREPPVEELVKSFLTPQNVAYDRNHGPLPYLDPATHKLKIAGSVPNPIILSISDLTNNYPQHSVLAALQCAGNRRHTMRTRVREVDGIDWNDGAVCNAEWSGPLLKDILETAGVKDDPEVLKGLGVENGHCWFDCDITKAQDDELYGVSVDLKRCLDAGMKVILALKMNGEPLSVGHGFPLRIVIPGVAGARWTKWLTCITVSPTESPNFYQQRDYKVLPPHVRSKAVAAEYWPKLPALQHLPINSIVATPSSNTTIQRSKPLVVSGYALPNGDDGPITGVDVSFDDAKSWRNAEIVWPSKEQRARAGEDEFKWCWAIWRYVVPVEELEHAWTTFGSSEGKILSRARDRMGNMQDGTVPWNFRGVAYNAYGEANGLRIEDADAASGEEKKPRNNATAKNVNPPEPSARMKDLEMGFGKLGMRDGVKV